MHAPLHGCDGNFIHFSDHKLAGVSFDRGFGESGDFFVGNVSWRRQIVRKGAQAGTQDNRNFRTQSGFRKYVFSCSLRAREVTEWVPPGTSGAHYIMIPTMEADMRLAIVPAIKARIPSCASSVRLFGARAPMPPIWMPMELKFAKPQSAKVAMV